MSEYQGNNHELFQLASMYAARCTSKRIKYQAEDFFFRNQLFIIATDPPAIVTPKRWNGEPYRSPLVAELANGTRLVVPVELIKQRLVKRMLNSSEKRIIARYIFI